MMLRNLLLAFCLLLPLPAAAQTLDGDWNGVLVVSGARLRVMIQFHNQDGMLTADLVSVDQSPTALHAESVTLSANQLVVSLPRLNSFYRGTLAGRTLTGSWTQNGVTAPLTLTPGTIAPLKLVRTPQPGDLTITTAAGTLAGTIQKAGDGKIGAVLITGSGPANRDGETAGSTGPGTNRMLADGLAARGITSLRFDKRGVGESAAAVERDLPVQMYGDDVRAWAAELKHRLGTRCVWLIGHSEGALIAELAADGNADICGLVSLAGIGRAPGASLREQLARMLPAERQSEAFADIAALEAGHPVPTPPPELMGLMRPSVQPYLMGELALNPAALLAKLKVPVLILQGDADVQMSVLDAQALAKARPDATLKILPGVTHNLRLAKDAAPAPLAPGLTDTIADFLKSHP